MNVELLSAAQAYAIDPSLRVWDLVAQDIENLAPGAILRIQGHGFKSNASNRIRQCLIKYIASQTFALKIRGEDAYVIRRPTIARVGVDRRSA